MDFWLVIITQLIRIYNLVNLILCFEDPAKIKYQVELQQGGNPTKQVVNSSQLSRSKNLLTKDKIYIIIKLNCEVNENSIWTVNESARNRLNLNAMKYSDIFKGEPPHFETTYGRGQFSRTNAQKQNDSQKKSPNKSIDKKSAPNTPNSPKKKAPETKTSSSNSKSPGNLKANSSKNSINSRTSEGASRKSDARSKSLNNSKRNPPSDQSDTELNSGKIPHKAAKALNKKSN